MSSRRMSLGGGALRESSHNKSRGRSASRRMSFGGNDASFGVSETPGKDRRSLLDEWRRNKTRDRENFAPNQRDEMELKHKKPRLPPSSLASASASSQPSMPESTVNSSHNGFSTEGTTALERFRLRKQMRLQQQTAGDANNTSMSQDDSMSVSSYGGGSSLLLSSTPHRSSLAVQRSQRSSYMPHSLSQETVASSLAPSHATTVVTQNNNNNTSLSQLTTEDDPTLDTVEGAGLLSRVREMKQRVEQLEKEKFDLSMSKAPLEARFRQKEDAWSKEQKSLLQEIDSLKEASRNADEQYRDLQVQYEAVEEECKQLRLEVRKASSSLHQNNNRTYGLDNGWSRQLQNDRDVLELKEKLRHAEEEIDSIRLTKVSVEKELHATKIELDSVLRSFDELQQEYEEISQSTSDNREAEIKLQVLTTEHIATAAQLNAVCSDLAATKARANASMEAKEEEHRKEVEQMQFEMSVLQNRAAKIVEEDANKSMMETGEEDDAVLKARIEERDRRIKELESQLLKSEEQRRRMHNLIQELRGNIRVFVRTRPFLPSDGQATDSAIDVSPDGESLSIQDMRSGAPHGFKFDKVFPPSSGQDSVFKEVSDFVQSALDGYHVCLFSYGQTGSGKTHTMQGTGNGAMRGIIPRAVEQILTQAKILKNQRWNFQLSASFLEIYNEDLKDLLVSMDRDKSLMSKAPKLSIKRNREGKSYVDGLTEVPIEINESEVGMQQLDALMAVAARARSVASTKMNAQSSRSHSVFMLHLRGSNEESGAIVEGALNLCDLAGSERLDRSGAASDAKRLRETQAINKSLSCLGDVFNALGQRASHVPYRNSKLTYLLQDCLSGDGKALMFVNLSPTEASSSESLCSLRFAQRVNQVELGKPTKNIHYSN